MVASVWAMTATRWLCSWMLSGYVVCMRPQRLMNFMRARYAKRWLTPAMISQEPGARRAASARSAAGSTSEISA